MIAKPVSIGLSLLFILAHAMFLTYVIKLEGMQECACARHPYLDAVKYFSAFMIVYVALAEFGFLSTDFLPASILPFMGVLGTVVSIASIVVYVLALRWISMQIQVGCKCSEEIRRTILHWWSFIFLAIVVVVALTPFVMVLTSSIGSTSVGKLKYAVMHPIATVRDTVSSVRETAKTSYGKSKDMVNMMVNKSSKNSYNNSSSGKGRGRGKR